MAIIELDLAVNGRIKMINLYMLMLINFCLL